MKLRQDVFIGKNLQQLREQAGYSQESLARELQQRGYNYISRDIISKIENGKYNIRIGLLIRLKHLYDVPYDEFFKEN